MEEILVDAVFAEGVPAFGGYRFDEVVETQGTEQASKALHLFIIVLSYIAIFVNYGWVGLGLQVIVNIL